MRGPSSPANVIVGFAQGDFQNGLWLISQNVGNKTKIIYSLGKEIQPWTAFLSEM